MAKYSVVSVDTIFETIQAMQGRDYVLRGQADVSWDMSSSFARVFRRAGNPIAHCILDILRIEERSIELFCRNHHLFTGPACEYLQGQDAHIRQTIMQHYGSPTRLLDWTSDPYVALFFACYSDTAAASSIHVPTDGVLSYFSAARYETAAEQDQLVLLAQQNPYPYCREGTSYSSRDRMGDFINVSKCAYRDEPLSFIRVIKYYPGLDFPRARAQRGLFTITGNPLDDHKILLSELLKEHGGLESFVFDHQLKAGCLERLAAMGYTRDVLMQKEPHLDEWGSAVKKSIEQWIKPGVVASDTNKISWTVVNTIDGHVAGTNASSTVQMNQGNPL